jgi:dTDP-4-dehydrorhamnose reductase
MKKVFTVLVLGCDGQLGKELQAQTHLFPEWHFIFTNRSTLDINEDGSIDKIITLKPDVVINAAAFTAVDKAELEINTCTIANTYAVGWIAKACKALNATFIHVSTDYVYHNNGNMPLKETDQTAPKNIYAVSKLNGEKLAMAFNPKTIIIRSSWIYSFYGNNFVKTMLKLAETRTELNVVYDQFGAPTNAADLASTILVITNKINKTPYDNIYGIYNYANEGITTWKAFAETIFEKTNKNIKVNPVTTEIFNAPALRPKWSVLNLSKIKSTFNLKIPHWTTSLAKMLSQIEV